MQRRINESHEWLVCEHAGGLVGYAYAGRLRPRAAYDGSVEVSVYVAADAPGAGIGRKLLTSLLERLKARDFVNAFAGIALPNPASVRLFESVGFEQIGIERSVGFKLGAWHDVGWWQVRLLPAADGLPPAEPLGPQRLG